MKKAFNKIEISQDEKEMIVAWIKNVVDIWYDDFERLKKEKAIAGRQKYVLKFWMFWPKEYPDLYAKFKEVICQPDIDKEIAKQEWMIKGAMQKWKSDFIEHHFIDSSNYDLVKYQKITMKEWQHKDWKIEKILHIAIPYMTNQSPKPHFGYWILISSLRTPQLFADFMADIPQFNWDTNLISNKQ